MPTALLSILKRILVWARLWSQFFRLAIFCGLFVSDLLWCAYPINFLQFSYIAKLFVLSFNARKHCKLYELELTILHSLWCMQTIISAVNYLVQPDCCVSGHNCWRRWMQPRSCQNSFPANPHQARNNVHSHRRSLRCVLFYLFFSTLGLAVDAVLICSILACIFYYANSLMIN